MTKNDFCILLLTCANKDEADKIANTLLVKHLVACVRQLPVSSDYYWQGKINHDNEIMLIMESRLDLFEPIEAEIVKLHSYDTFVLEAMPLEKISSKARGWLIKEL